MESIFKKRLFIFVLAILLLSLFFLNKHSPYLPTGDQALLEYLSTQTHSNYWPQNVSAYISNQIYIFSELIYYLDFIFPSVFLKYLFLLLMIVSFSYLVLYYIFLKLTKGDTVFSAFAPIVFLVSRFALGAEFWGITKIGEVQGRAFYTPFFFLLYYFTFRALESKKIHFLFLMGLLTSLSFVVYPGGGFYLTLILTLTLFLSVFLKKINLKHFFSFVIGCGFGFLPTLLNLLSNKNARIDGIVSQFLKNKENFNVIKFNEIALSRFSNIFGEGWNRMAVEVFILVCLGLFLYFNHKKYQDKNVDFSEASLNTSFISFSVTFLVSVILVTFGIPLVQKILVDIFHWPYFFFEQLRSSRYFYAPFLFIFLQYLFLFYKRKEYRLVIFFFVASCSSLLLFQPLINDILFHVLPQDFRTKYKLAKSNTFAREEKIQSQAVSLREASMFMRRYENQDKKVFVIANDNIHLNFRSVSHLNTNTIWKEFAFVLIQRPFDAEVVAEEIKQIESFMFSDPEHLSEFLKEKYFTDIVISRSEVDEKYLQFFEQTKKEGIDFEKEFENEGFFIYKILLTDSE
jgi:hypothetical protein